MKNLSLLILIVLATSCVQVAFESPQPAGVESVNKIPSGFHGSYTLNIMGEEGELVIGKDFIRSEQATGYISDSVIVKYQADKLYFNKRINVGDESFWEFYVFENKGCGIFKGSMLIGADDDAVKTLQEEYNSRLIEIPTVAEAKKYLVLDPTAKELDELMESESTYSVYMEKNKK